MRRVKIARWALIGIALATPTTSALAAGKHPEWEEGTVISQMLGSQNAGVYAAPIGAGAVAIPITATSNVVVIDGNRYRYTLSEADIGKARIFRRSYSTSPVILPVEG